jgi:hypothetical protein
MDRNKYTRNILIALIGIASIILGVMFANLTYQFTKRNSETQVEKNDTEDIAIEETAITESAEPELYETCVLISTDKDIILNNSDLLEKNGYPVKINETQRANKLIFSLIIDKQLPKEDAILLGEEIKEKFQVIRSYWVEEVSDKMDNHQESAIESVTKDIESEPDETESTQPPQENLQTETSDKKDDGTLYDIQIMANTDPEKINTTKQFLEAEGYRLKIVEFKKDGITYYRLRLAQSYNLKVANTLGEELKQNFKFINSYWLDKIVK